jgi:hypothetical protein
MLARGPETGNLRPSVHQFSMRKSSPPLITQHGSRAAWRSIVGLGSGRRSLLKPLRSIVTLVLTALRWCRRLASTDASLAAISDIGRTSRSGESNIGSRFLLRWHHTNTVGRKCATSAGDENGAQVTIGSSGFATGRAGAGIGVRSSSTVSWSAAAPRAGDSWDRFGKRSLGGQGRVRLLGRRPQPVRLFTNDQRLVVLPRTAETCDKKTHRGAGIVVRGPDNNQVAAKLLAPCRDRTTGQWAIAFPAHDPTATFPFSIVVQRKMMGTIDS